MEKFIKIIFDDITFSDPEFPWTEDLNTSYRAEAQPQDWGNRYEGNTRENKNNVAVWVVASVPSAKNHFWISLTMVKRVFSSRHEYEYITKPVFTGEGDALPITVNTQPYGGSATIGG